jgi:hypothetical protein
MGCRQTLEWFPFHWNHYSVIARESGRPSNPSRPESTGFPAFAGNDSAELVGRLSFHFIVNRSNLPPENGKHSRLLI